jgi:hypothetical protein
VIQTGLVVMVTRGGENKDLTVVKVGEEDPMATKGDDKKDGQR